METLEFIDEPARRSPVSARVDVVVLGGGPAGVAAAAAAGRAGASTLLIERYGFLGGAGTASMVSNFCGLFAHDADGKVTQVVHGVTDEILAALSAADALAPRVSSRRLAVTTQAYDISAYKVVLDDILAAADVRTMFHTVAVAALVHDGHIDGVVIESKSGRSVIRGAAFIDASGDADLAAWCGVPFEVGDARGNVQFPTMMFRMGQVDHARAQSEGLPQIDALMAQAEASGRYRFARKTAIVRPQPHSTEYRVNVTQISRNGTAISGIDADELTFGEIDGRRQARRFADFLREYVPGFGDAYLLEIAPQLGIRETRRVSGAYRVTEADVLGAAAFEDTVGVNPWPIEEHVAGDITFSYIGGRGYHEIPYRSLVTREIDNLLVAGRCASMDHLAQGATRVTGPCLVMGEATGTAAAIALDAGIGVADVPIATLQARLRDGGALLD